MAVPIPAETVHTDVIANEESFLHFAARESRVLLRWSAIILAAVTVVTMITFWFWAIIPALLLLVALAALLLARGVEQYSESGKHGITTFPPPATTSARALVVVKEDVIDELPVAADPVETRLIWRESALVILLMISLGILAVIVAATLLPSEIRWLAMLVIFAFMMLAAAPVWLGSIEDDIEEESARMTRNEE